MYSPYVTISQSSDEDIDIDTLRCRGVTEGHHLLVQLDPLDGLTVDAPQFQVVLKVTSWEREGGTGGREGRGEGESEE